MLSLVSPFVRRNIEKWTDNLVTSGNDDQDDHKDLNDLDGEMKVASQTIDRVV